MPRRRSPAGAVEPAREALASAPETPRGPGVSKLERQELARHLGLRASELKDVSDRDVEEAMRRLGGLMDRISELEARAVHDDLTSVLRRGAGLEALRLELARARRLSQPITVVFLDIDGLKRVNDSRGHTAGDAVICAVAATLRRRLRATDLVMRHGGDEFVCVLPGATAESAERVLAEVNEAIREATGGVSVSAGLATVDPGGEPTDPVAIVGAADLDLYRRRADRPRPSTAG